MVPCDLTEDLLKKVLESPDRHWSDFWDAVHPLIRWKVSSFHLSPEDSQDVISEISFRLVKDDFRLLRNWDGERCSLKGYLSVISKSTAIDFLQSSYFRYNKEKAPPPPFPEERDLLGSLPDEDLTPDMQVHRIQVHETVFRAIEKWGVEGGLTPQDQQILKCRLFGVGFQEIADLLGLSRENAMVRFHRLKVAFRKKLEEAGIGPQDGDG